MSIHLYACGNSSQLPRNQCRKLWLNLHRHLLLKHDFVALRFRQTFCGIYLMQESLDVVGMCQILTHTLNTFRPCFIKLYSYIKFPRIIVNSYYTTNIKNSNLTGGGTFVFAWDEISPYILSEISPHNIAEQVGNLSYNSHLKSEDAQVACKNYDALVPCRIPIGTLVQKMTIRQIHEIAKQHNIIYSTRLHLDSLQQALKDHNCELCSQTVTLFKSGRNKASTVADRMRIHREKHILKNNSSAEKKQTR